MLERLNKIEELKKELSNRVNKWDINNSSRFYYSKQIKPLEEEIKNLIIEENKEHHVYWEADSWIYDIVKEIKQDFSLSGQARTTAFVNVLNQIPGCVVSELDAGYQLEIFTPYKVYLYTFRRGYGDYPIHIEKGFIAPSGNTYKNKIFLAKNTKDMKDNYFNYTEYGGYNE